MLHFAIVPHRFTVKCEEKEKGVICSINKTVTVSDKDIHFLYLTVSFCIWYFITNSSSSQDSQDFFNYLKAPEIFIGDKYRISKQGSRRH